MFSNQFFESFFVTILGKVTIWDVDIMIDFGIGLEVKINNQNGCEIADLNDKLDLIIAHNWNLQSAS